MKLYFLIIIFFLVGCFENIVEVRPSTEIVTYRYNLIFVPNPMQTGEIGNVPPFIINVPASNDPNNCNASNQVPKQIDWQMTDNNEFLDFTIFDIQGVDPGTQKAYFLISSTGIRFPFFMAQSAAATVKLYQETWRLKLNANEIPIQNEVCNAEVYPAPGSDPFERIFPANTSIGNQWTLNIPADANPGNISATLHYDLHLLNFPHCINN